MKRDERIRRRSSDMTAHIFAGHTVKSGMTVIVRWGAIAVYANNGSSFQLLSFSFDKKEN